MMRRFGRYVGGGLCMASLITGWLLLQPPHRASGQGKKDAPKADKPLPSAATKGLEQLLTESKLAYSKNVRGEEITYTVTYGDGPETRTVITAKEKTWGWKYADGSPEKHAYLYADMTNESLRLPKRFKPSAELMKKVCEWNDNIDIGNLSLNQGMDGTVSIFFNCGFLLRNVDGEVLRQYYNSVYVDVQQYRKELKPFLTE